MLWQKLLEDAIRSSASVAVLVGSDGLGPWEEQEMRAALALAVSDQRPVIPFLMPGAPAPLELPIFLGGRTWVDLRDGFTDEALGNAFWGITGARPRPPDKSPPARPATSPPSEPNRSVRRVRCKLSCIERTSDVIHARNAAFLSSLCAKFPNTNFRIVRGTELPEASREPVDPKEYLHLILGCFKHGEEITLEVSGQFEAMAALFFKIDRCPAP